ncbi:cellulase family glycosylhydrolase [Actinoplanes sp. NPDC026623]|uniref:glycoside hydrolase family 5 protein n=1 Tax=Actinoplanes sp. NPDC026623 TaxID=3155610 RepID=UPI0033ECEC64
MSVSRRMTAALAVVAGLLTVTVYAPAEAAAQPLECNSSPPTGGQPDRLKVKVKPQPEPKIIDPTTKKSIVLRGYNWGEWDTAQFPKDPNENVAQGANSVRIPLRWWGDYKTGVDSYDKTATTTGYIEPCHLKLLDETIKQAVDKHLWVILFADSDNGQGSGPDQENNFWNPKNKDKRDQFKELWRFLTKRYQNTPYIGALEILPEPNLNTGGKGSPTPQDDDDVRFFYEEFIGVIRGIDRDTPIVVGPNDLYNIKRLNNVVTSVDDNIIYTGDYFIHEGAPLDRTQDLSAFQNTNNAPVWINQVGIPSGATEDLDDNARDEAARVLDDLNDRGIGWSWWTYRVRTTKADTHGIYYVDPTDANNWIRKDKWYELVGEHLPQH